MENRSISFDILCSGLITLGYFLIFYFYFKAERPFYYLSNQNTISLFITVITSILGAIVVVLSLFTVFEDTYKNNKAILILKARGQYNQIFRRYIDSIFVMFFGIILFSIIYLAIPIVLIYPQVFQNLVFGIVFCILLACFIRVYRCFKVFSLLQTAINETEKSSQ